jgi:hypothetical protein
MKGSAMVFRGTDPLGTVHPCFRGPLSRTATSADGPAANSIWRDVAGGARGPSPFSTASGARLSRPHRTNTVRLDILDAASSAGDRQLHPASINVCDSILPPRRRAVGPACRLANQHSEAERDRRRGIVDGFNVCHPKFVAYPERGEYRCAAGSRRSGSVRANRRGIQGESPECRQGKRSVAREFRVLWSLLCSLSRGVSHGLKTS